MSGLRETIRRRGGLELTSRVVGGLWVVGERTVPEKPSPYNAAATAALMAAFPTQWPTIRDYGWQHEEIVGYMNAYAPEDAKIAYSLVPTLGVIRLLVGSGGAYINSGYQFTTNYGRLKMLFVPPTMSGTMQPCGIYTASADRRTMGMYIGTGINGTALQAGSKNTIVPNPTAGVPYEVDFKAANGTVIYTAGGTSGTSTYNGTIAQASDWYLYAINYTQKYQVPIGVQYCQLYAGENDEMVIYYIPFIRKINGVETCGMLNLVNGEFKVNAHTSGSFTISETPAS